jgi:hypothetical protein
MPKKKQLAESRDDNFFLEEELEGNLDLDNQMGIMMTSIMSTAMGLTKIICEKDKSIQSKDDVLEAFSESFEEVQESLTSMSL